MTTTMVEGASLRVTDIIDIPTRTVYLFYGETIPEGAKVMLLWTSGNRDRAGVRTHGRRTRRPTRGQANPLPRLRPPPLSSGLQRRGSKVA